VVKKIAVLVLLVVISSCYSEWDVPRVPRRDPCFGRVENKYVYVEPTCRNPSPRNPHDLDYDGHNVYGK
jgi:hypothetical protein